MKTKARARWTHNDDYALELQDRDLDFLRGAERLYGGKACPSRMDTERYAAIRAEIARREAGVEQQLAA